jgi:hypothetical protein
MFVAQHIVPANTNLCSKKDTQEGCPVVPEKAPSFQVVTAFVLSKSSLSSSSNNGCRCKASNLCSTTLKNLLIFQHQLQQMSLADAVIVIASSCS